MSRARNLKPGFFTNGDLLECQPLARLLFAGLWCEADRRGVLEDRPKTLKVKILPGDNCDIEELLGELAARGFIQRYEVGGIRCIHITNFDKHQNPHVKEQPNDLPLPGESDASTGRAPGEHSTSPADSLLLIPDSGNQELSLSREAAQAPSKRKTLRPIPDDFVLTDELEDYAVEKGMPPGVVAVEFERLRSWAEAKGERKVDWPATWRSWVLRYVNEPRAPTRPNGLHSQPAQQTAEDRANWSFYSDG